MANLTLRQVKGSPLTIAELDGNFEYFTGSFTNTGIITAQGFSGSFTGSIATASYVNPLEQDVQLTGSLFVNGGTFMNVVTQSIPFTVPSEYNALLVGPIFLATTLSVSGTLVII
jgi:hypothetical protein